MTAFIISAFIIAWIIVIFVNTRPTKEEKEKKKEEKEYQEYKKMMDSWYERQSKSQRFTERYYKEKGE